MSVCLKHQMVSASGVSLSYRAPKLLLSLLKLNWKLQEANLRRHSSLTGIYFEGKIVVFIYIF